VAALLQSYFHPWRARTSLEQLNPSSHPVSTHMSVARQGTWSIKVPRPYAGRDRLFNMVRLSS
jgi:hypothetical protein